MLTNKLEQVSNCNTTKTVASLDLDGKTKVHYLVSVSLTIFSETKPLRFT